MCFLTNLFREFSFFVGVRYGSHCGLKIYSVWADGNREMFTTKFTKGHELGMTPCIPLFCGNLIKLGTGIGIGGIKLDDALEFSGGQIDFPQPAQSDPKIVMSLGVVGLMAMALCLS